MVISIVSRYHWGATPTTTNISSLQPPVQYVLSAFTKREFPVDQPGVTNTPRIAPPPGAPTIDCIEAMQNLQAYDMVSYPDIRYNFVIAPDGNVYKGRGWSAAPTLPSRYDGLMRKCLYIGYLGDFTEYPPPNEYFEAKQEIIEFGVKKGYVNEKFIDINYKNAFFRRLLNELLTFR